LTGRNHNVKVGAVKGAEGPEGSVGVNSRLSAVPEAKPSGAAENEAGIWDAEGPAGAINVAQALEISQSDTFVSEMEGGTQAKISQGGANVSGGQRQRLCIARAVSQNARAYLFDDSFSALDYKTDAAVRDALTSQLGHATRIIVAQRIATIMAAEHIVVLDDGRVVGQGTHAQLMQTCAEYKEIALSQLSETELGIGGDAA
jgi:ATP-binding cassette subfamily B protein